MKRRRIAAWVLGSLAALLLIAAALTLLSRVVADSARRRLETRAAAITGGPVAISRLRVGWLPPTIHIEQARADRKGSRGSEAHASVKSITIRAGLLTLLGLRQGPVSVVADDPHLAAVLLPGRLGAAKEREGTLLSSLLTRVPPGSSLTLGDGAIEIEVKGDWSVRLSGVRIESRARDGGPAIGGRILFAGGALRAGPAGDWEDLQGEGSWTLNASGLEVEALSLRGKGMALSGHARVEAGGAGVEGEIQVGMELKNLERFLPAAAAPTGHVEARLTGSWHPGALRAQGDLRAVALHLWGLQMDSLDGDLEIDGGARLKGIRAHLFGGEVTGSATLSFAPAGMTGETDLSVDGVDLAQVLAYAGWGGPPVRGTIHYRGRHRIDARGIESLRGAGLIDAVGHYVSPRGVDLPLEVTSNLETTGDTILLEGGTIRAGSVRGGFSGTVTPGDGVRLRLRGATGDISEVLPLFAPPPPRPAPQPAEPKSGGGAKGQGETHEGGRTPVRVVAYSVDAPAESPLERLVHALGGRWEWNGDLHYDRGGLSFAGLLEGTGLTFHDTRIGSLQASVRYGQESLAIAEATFHPDEGGEIRLSGTIGFRDSGSIALDGTATDCPLAPLLALAWRPLSASGKLSARFNVGGRPTAPTGRATLEAGPVTLEGVPFETLKGALAITPQEFEARSLTLAQGGGSLVFDGRIPIRAESSPTPGGAAEGEGTKSDQLSISGRGLDLSRWAGTVTGLGVEGTATVEGSIRGAITAPVGSLTIRGSRLRGAGADVGEAVIEADFVADAIELKASIPQRGVAVEGRVGLGEGRPVDLRATLSETRVRGAEIFPDAPEDVALVVSGRLEVQGPMARPRELRARATLPALAFEAGGISLTAEGPAVLTLEQGRVRLAPLVLSGNGTQIEMSGEAAPLDGGRLDAGARGTFDLRLLRSILPRLQATGTGEILLEIKGTRDSPDLRGSLRVAAEAIRHPGLPFPLDGVDGRAVFDGSTMRIEALRFMAGGGPIEATGEVQLAPAAAGLLPRTVSRGEIHFKGKNVKADLPEGFRSVFDVDLALRLDAEGATLGGRIDLVKGVYNRDFRIESTLVGGRSAGLFDLPQPQGTLADLKLDLTIAAAGEVWLRNDFATIEGQGELKVGGTVARPRVAGRITAVEGGTLRFRKVRYRVGNGTVDFADPERVAPRFDLQAETTVAEYQVTLHVEGTLDDFRYELTSSPPLPQQEIVGLLLTGHTLGTLTGAVGPEGQVLAEETATAYLSGRLSEELTQRLSGRSGLDLISINPLQVNAQGDPTMRVTIGKQVTPDLYVTYSNSLGSSQGSIYQLDYSLGRDFKLTSLRDRDGSIGGDVKFIRRGRPPSLPALEGPATSTIKRSALGAVRLEGHLHFRESKVRRQLRLREGRPLDRAAVNDGVERLLALYRDHGFLMAEVEAREVPEEDGGRVGLQVSVTPGQRIDIRLEGTRNREGLRQKVAPYWQKGIFLEDIVDAASGRLKTYFRDRGYLSAEVTSEVRRNDDEVFRVLFSVRRGPRVRADEVRITGARQIPEKQVRKILHTAPDTLFSRGIVRSARLRDDAAAVRALYLSRGFPEVVVPMPEVVLDDSGRRAAVVLHVDEGPHVTLRRLVFEGNRSLSTDNLETIATLPPGSPYTTETVEAASARLRRAYDDAGFPDARLDHRLQPGETRESERRDDLVFQVQEGRFQTIAAVEINGNLITRDDVIRKALAVTPDHSLSRADLLSSQTRLYQRGIFSSVEVETAPGGGESAEGAEPRVVKVAVREAAPLNQVFGIGYDSEEKARGQYEIANRNILGSGRYLGLQTRASNLQEHVSLLYREPGVLGGNYEALASAFWEDEERPAFDVRTVGLSLQASRRFTRATRTLYRYSLKDVDLSNAAAIFEGSTLRLSSLSASAVHDTRDAPFDPLRGHYLSGEVQYFGRSIGSEAEFAKLYGQVYYFREVLPKTVWAQAVRAGAAIPLGRSKADPTLTGDALSGVPPSERYFAGGDTTVRGFARDRLGPLDASGDPIGGEGLFLLNEELRFPIFRILQGVVFYDAGNVFRTLADYDPTDLRQVLGAGLRLATPIGPFRFEYGSLLNRRDGEPGHKFFISIGQAF